MFLRPSTISATLQEVGFFLPWFISTFWDDLMGLFGKVFSACLWPDLGLVYSLLKGCLA